MNDVRTYALMAVSAWMMVSLACGGDPVPQEQKVAPTHDPWPEGREAVPAKIAPAPPRPEPRGTLATDGALSTNPALAAKVRDGLRKDPDTTLAQITVQASGGTVTLSGFVDSASEKMAAARVARSVATVERVDNNLTVGRSDDKAGDGAVAVRVKAALIADPVTTGREINVDALQGVVQLSGQVGTVAEKQRAGDVAAQVKGVTNVRNKLQVQP